MEEKIIDLLEEKFTDPEFANCFWLDVKLLPNKKLEVIIDCDTGVTFDTCRKISRYLESFIDEEQWLGEKYTLEVSSPGTDRPLQRPRQYTKHLGRKLEVKTNEGETYEGRLTEKTDEAITLTYKVRRKEGKRKVTEEVQTKINFADIKQAKVKISFNKP
ncbi:MAG: ribosome assembly cofactor RimP [Bacteroidota bacterium]